jgi:hypothetical protein
MCLRADIGARKAHIITLPNNFFDFGRTGKTVVIFPIA